MDKNILVAKSAGFCFGVKRAVDAVYSLLDEGKTVCTLGPIIHNPQMVDTLTKRGVVIVNTPEETTDGATLVIRSHGVPKDVYDTVEHLGLTCHDATCPFVAKIHRIVSEQSANGAAVLIAGDEGHPEVIGIRGHCHTSSYVFSSEDELLKLEKSGIPDRNAPVILVAQTTFHMNTWKKCSKIAKKHYTNLIIFDTICSATAKRQEEAIALSQQSDVMVIVGGRQSSNTAKLREVCRPYCQTLLIEKAEELTAEPFAGAKVIGLTAGASTPSDIIKEVLSTMSEIVNNSEVQENEVAVAAEPVKSFDEMSFEEALEASLQSLTTNERVHGIVVGIAPNEVQVEVIGRKQTGYIPTEELSAEGTDPSELVKVGDELELLIMRTNDQEGTIMLSKKRVDAKKGWDTIVAAGESGEILEGVVTDVIKGGVLVASHGVKVFVPASRASVSRMEDLSPLLKQTVRFKILEINTQRRRAVGSIRDVAREERREKEEAFFAQAEVGQKYTGVVKSMTSYGAFVDLGGVDGMIHVSELSWKHIKHPSEVVSIGDTVEVYIRDLDAEKHKISLGYRRAEDNPFELFKAQYAVGDVVSATIVGMTTFGAFAQILPGVDGLIHISQIANRRIDKPQDALKVGEEVQVKITAVDMDSKRISLSIRALLEDAPAVEETAPEAAEEVTEEVAPEVVEETAE
ncbi:MAG: bifunctional 4-hydroxy-3-methylbut-2-enyl diphosphate reductase/30S ribosomal protein S1 [Clostridia bacterium]|nr:bifunctional 4-hydroxy-3-methylbut-2-enyl diphosphate reductase/30S ribosomal protein S1 [Clostridia bacterium]